MNRKSVSLAAVLLLLLLPSCHKSVEPVKLREFTSADLVPAKMVAENFADGFFKSIAAKDFSHWQKVIPQRSEQTITEEKFQKFYNELHTSFGKFETAEYLGELVSGDLINYLWRMRFSKQENGKTIVRDIVFFVRVYCEENKQPDVSGFGVKLF